MNGLAGAKPRFRSGNVVTPPNPTVTERKSARPDFIPPDPLTSVAAVPLHVDGQPNKESSAAERAKIDRSTTRENVVVEVAGMTRREADGAWLLANGFKVRTVDMGDDALHPPVMVPTPTRRQTRAAARKESDREILAALADLGIKIDRVTPKVREGWRDFVALKRAEAGL